MIPPPNRKNNSPCNFCILLPLIMTVFLLSGCASFYVHRYPGKYYPPTNPIRIDVYNNYPPVDYEVIGEVGGSGAPACSWDRMVEGLKEKAADLGGNAVVIVQSDTPYVGTYNAPGQSYTSANAYQSLGMIHGSSQTTYYPGASIPMYGKNINGIVIKYVKEENNFRNQRVYSQEERKLYSPEESKPVNSEEQTGYPDLKEWFSLGSEKSEVIALQGAPDYVSDSMIVYEPSYVYMDQGKVTGWADSKHILKIKLISKNKTKTSYSIGSSVDDVIGCEGTPDSYNEKCLVYGSSKIWLENGRVQEWFVGNHKLHIKGRNQ